MRSSVKLGALLGAVLLGGLSALFLASPGEVQVREGEPLQPAIDSAPRGSTVTLEAGEHRGPLFVTHAIELVAEPGARITAPPSAPSVVTVTSDDVRLDGLTLEGGESGLVVREAEGVELQGLTISGAGLHGIEVVDASAHIEGAVVSGLRSALAQGIEIRNADGRPDSVVERSRVAGGMSGLVSHVSEVRFLDNQIENTTLRGIDVTEMSDGFVEGNTVTGAAGTGLYCGDMSRCHFENNVVASVSEGEGGLSAAGWGLVVTYHAAASSFENQLAGRAGAFMTSLGGHMTERSPLDPGRLSDVLPSFATAFLVAAALCLVALAVSRPLTSRLERGSNAKRLAGSSALVAIACVVLTQSFHMVEHFLQIYRIHVDHVPSRGGLAGPSVESEFVHMAYNSGVLILLLGAIWTLRGRIARSGVTLATAATIVQAWHFVEHVSKTIGHITTGAKVNPGILGAFFDLAWFHFTINLAVYALSLAAAVVAVRSLLERRAAVAPAFSHPASV